MSATQTGDYMDLVAKAVSEGYFEGLAAEAAQKLLRDRGAVKIALLPHDELLEIWQRAYKIWHEAGDPPEVILDIAHVNVMEAMYIVGKFCLVYGGQANGAPKFIRVIDPRTLEEVDMETHLS